MTRFRIIVLPASAYVIPKTTALKHKTSLKTLEEMFIKYRRKNKRESHLLGATEKPLGTVLEIAMKLLTPHGGGGNYSYSRRTPYTRPENHQRKQPSKNSDSYRYEIPPSTERTLTARHQPRERNYQYIPRGRDASYNSYHSREYRRSTDFSEGRTHNRNNQPRSLWVEKPNQKDVGDHRSPHNLEKIERSESSRPAQAQPQQTRQLPTPKVTEHALNVALEEVREYMNQYSACADPTESAARRERVRQAEENGEFEEVAASLALTTFETQRRDAPEEPMEITPDRIPAMQRIGPVNDSISALRRLGPLNETEEMQEIPLSEPAPKRKLSRSTVRRTTPTSMSIHNAGT